MSRWQFHSASLLISIGESKHNKNSLDNRNYAPMIIFWDSQCQEKLWVHDLYSNYLVIFTEIIELKLPSSILQTQCVTYLVILGVEMLRKPGWAIYSMFLSKISARTFCLAILFLLLLVFFCARTVGYAAENFVRSIRSNSHSHLSLLLKIDIFSLDFVNSGSLFQCFTTRLEKNWRLGSVLL